MEYITEGGQARIFKDENFVYREYKNVSCDVYSIDEESICLLNKLNMEYDFKMMILPSKIRYDSGKIIGTYSRYINGNKEFDLSNVSCKKFYQYYLDYMREIKILSAYNIRIYDFVIWNFLVNDTGIYFVDPDLFKVEKAKQQSEILKENIDDLNSQFIYGLIFNGVGRFVSKKSLQEIMESLSDRNDSLYDFVISHDVYELQNKEINNSFKR